MESIFGPFNGYYVAVYLCDKGSRAQEYLAYFKVTDGAPTSYWDAEYLCKRPVAGTFASRKEAEEVAVQLARLHIAGLRARIRNGLLNPERDAAARQWTPHQYPPTMPAPL